MKIAIITDSWKPLVNGVVKTLEHTAEELKKQGHDVLVINPSGMKTIPCPSYPDIRLSVFPYRVVSGTLDDFRPDAIHIATEGPLGHAARRYCLKNKLQFSTSWHTQFPEYIRLRYPIPKWFSYAYLRRFHSPATHTLVTTPTIKQQLHKRGFKHLKIWSRGVDTKIFHPGYPRVLKHSHPILLYMGRVAVEKNIETFLGLNIKGTKVVVGDGPQLAELKEKYPEVIFTGEKKNEDLAAYVASADVFVFPSVTDTFGLVLLEAMACGVPVAAFPVQGPKDVINYGVTGYMDKNLAVAIKNALRLNRHECAEYASHFTWKRSTEIFARFLVVNEKKELASDDLTGMTLNDDRIVKSRP